VRTALLAAPSPRDMAQPDQQAGAETILSMLAARMALPGSEVVRARDLAQASGSALGDVLDRIGLVPQHQWMEAVAETLGCPFAARADLTVSPPDPPRLSFEFQEMNALALIGFDDTTATVAIADPPGTVIARALAIALRRKLAFVVCTRRDVLGLVAEMRADAEGITAKAGQASSTADRDQLIELANDAPTIRFVETIFAKAIESKATDIHLEPFDGRVRIRMRIDGMLYDDLAFPSGLFAGVVSRLKILAGMDIGERRLPQDGRIRHRGHGAQIDMRVSCVPSLHGETIALRLLDLEKGAGSIEGLRMPPDVQTAYERGLDNRSGLLIVTGPTGSGKTTTLHALLGALNAVDRKIVTVENPAEIRVPGVVQVEANPDIGLTFAAALRSFLRQDPDVIMVGEIRDRETAEVAIQAALTGHLVLSTLHTNNAATAVTRLADMGIDRYLIRSTLRLAGAQRLVRILCDTCAEPADTIATQTSLADSLRDHMAETLPPRHTWKLRSAKGCRNCAMTGYRGRRAIFEALPAGQLFGDDTTSPRIMLHHGTSLVCEGITTMEEVRRVVDDGA
jgi:type II secretory ATPase GspE/PulE/Tfp pilus assembly ATPase PilB-like protein